MREMVGGCCVCADEQGWNENPLVYCDGQGCTVAVHQACYGIVTVPSGPWYCRKCESQERAARVRCELCPNKDGALKRTDNGGWAHVVCALYIPEVRFGNVATMEPIILALVPQERFNKVCYICLETTGRESKASHGACMQCNKAGCKDAFHVTCAQAAGLLCEEAGNYMDNVKYCGYCDHHFQKINKKLVKAIPAFRPAPTAEEGSPSASPDKAESGTAKDPTKLTNSSSASCNSKGKGKRGRKPGSMIYEPKLEPPKFNPDLASLNQSNNSLNSVNNSVTLTPVTNFNNINNHKSVNNFSSNNSDGAKIDRILNDKANNKTPNVVVKIGKHGEVHHAKKDSPFDNLINTSPSESEAILERVTASTDTVKEEVIDKKGFTTANFTESFLPSSSVSVTASLIKHDSDKHSYNSDKVDTSRVKLEAPESLDAPSSVSLVNVSKTQDTSRPGPGHRDLEADTSTGPSNSSHNLIPHYKGDLKTAAPAHPVSLSSSESQSSGRSSAGLSGPGGAMYSRSGLHSSVSLFPTNMGAGGPHTAKPDNNSQPNSTVSIIPSVTSNCSSTSLSASSVSSSLTVTPVESSAPPVTGASNLTNHITKSHTESVTISSLANDDRLTLETLNQSKNGAINPHTNKPDKVGNGPVKRMGRPPKKGTHTATSSLANVINIESEDEEQSSSASKRARTEEVDKVEEKVVKKEDSESGVHKFMMFGATINPSSRVAKEMSTVLQNEVASHSAYSVDNSAQLIGVPLPGRRQTHDSGRSAPHTVAGMLDPARQPQTLEELLERHWEQGSRFLMEQASHFDIASLLSSLHQLKEENLGLEDSVDRLIARRDHLLAVRARLLALNSLAEPRREQQVGNGPSSTNDRRLVSPVSSRPLVSPSRDKPLPSPRERGGPVPQPALPSPRDRRELPSPRDRDRSPRLPPVPHGHGHPLENGLDTGGLGPAHLAGLPPGYRHERQQTERMSNAQLLSVAQAQAQAAHHQANNSNHRGQHSPVSLAGVPHPHPPPKAHYSHPGPGLPPPPGHGPVRGHVELRASYPANYQMVSPPPPKGQPGPPMPAHSGHLSMSRSTPPGGMRSTPPGGPPPPHHVLPPEIHQHLMRASPQSSIHLKK